MFIRQYILLITRILIACSVSINAYSAETILYSKDDNTNPLSIWGIELTDYWSKLSADILRKYQNIDLTPHQMAVIFLNYTKDFELGFPKGGGHPRYVIEEKIGACGTFTNVFLALMRVNGIQGRVVNLYNYPKDTGHTVAEVFYGGAWHLYDPTYSAFYTTTPSEIIAPDVLSFKQLRSLEATGSTAIIVMNYQRYYMHRYSASQYVSFEIFKKANPAGPIGPKHKMYFPIKMNFSDNRIITKKDFPGKSQGAGFIGVAGINQNSKYSIRGLEANKKYRLVFDVDFIGGDRDLDSMSLVGSSDNCKIDKKDLFYKSGDGEIAVEFIATGSTCDLTIESNESGDFRKYMAFNSIILEAASEH